MRLNGVRSLTICFCGAIALLLSLSAAHAAPPRPQYLPLVLRNGFSPQPTASPAATATPSRAISATPTWTPFPTSVPTATETERPTPTVTPTPTPLSPNWVILLQEGFEGDWPGGWEVGDYRVGGGEYMWERRECRADSGRASAWAVGGGADGAALACGSDYPDEVESWMAAGPFSLADATAAVLEFAAWVNGEGQGDGLYYCLSTDDSQYSCLGIVGATGGWQPRLLDLARVPEQGGIRSYLGEPQLWLAFIFESDGAGHRAEGAYVDDIQLRKYVPTP